MSCRTRVRPKRPEGRTKQDGLTLIEVLVAGLVLSLSVVGVALMFGYAQTYLAAEVDDRIGVGLAQQKIELLKWLAFDCIPVGGPGQLHVPLGLGAATLTSLDCRDTPTTAGARKYNEDASDHPAIGERELPDPEHGAFQFYRSRITRVECVKATGEQFGQPESPCSTPPLAKRIRVEVVPHAPTARAIRVETIVLAH
jgi:hypothetical protein